MDLDEFHRSAVASEDREGGGAQVAAVQRIGVRCFGRDRRRTVAPGGAEAADDVVRFDARPHHDAPLGELRADRGEFAGESLLRGIDVSGAFEELVDGEQVFGAFGSRHREPAVTRRDAGGDDHARAFVEVAVS